MRLARHGTFSPGYPLRLKRLTVGILSVAVAIVGVGVGPSSLPRSTRSTEPSLLVARPDSPLRRHTLDRDIRAPVRRDCQVSEGKSRSYRVEGMSCGRCEAAVRAELDEVRGVEAVRVDMDAKQVVVGDFDDAAVRAAINEAGYEAAA